MSFGMNSLLRPPTSSFTKRDLWCQSNGERLYSVLVEPRNARGARPAIVCAHAFGGSFRDTLDFAESMARAGYVAAAIDFRGGSSRSQSEGEVENASVATMTRDIESVVAEVRSLRSVRRGWASMLTMRSRMCWEHAESRLLWTAISVMSHP